MYTPSVLRIKPCLIKKKEERRKKRGENTKYVPSKN
jgi:hypothetical protein